MSNSFRPMRLFDVEIFNRDALSGPWVASCLLDSLQETRVVVEAIGKSVIF